MQAGILRDRDLADVPRARYVEPLQRSSGGEELTGGSIGEQPTAIELWGTLQARQLTGR
jgi:hypothetical protein